MAEAKEFRTAGPEVRLLGILVLLVLVAGLAVLVKRTWWSSDNGGSRIAYGGSWSLTFAPEASPASRAQAIAACSALPGVTKANITASGAYLNGPPAGGSFSKRERKRMELQRSEIVACLTAQPGVVALVEGL